MSTHGGTYWIYHTIDQSFPCTIDEITWLSTPGDFSNSRNPIQAAILYFQTSPVYGSTVANYMYQRPALQLISYLS